MKTYDEIAARVFARRKEYLEQVKRRNKKIRILTVSLCVTVLLVIGVWSSVMLSPKEPTSWRSTIRKDNTPTVTRKAETEPPEAGKTEDPATDTEQMHGASAPDETAEQKPAQGTPDEVSGSHSTSTDSDGAPDEIVAAGSPVRIPALSISDIDRVRTAFVQYRGKIYTQTAWYDTTQVASLRGKKIGNASGSPDTAEAGDTLPSTIAGEVYEVKGYSVDFRLCAVVDDKTLFLDRLNGITLTNGSDLLRERLHAKVRLRTAEYETAKSWEKNQNIMHPTRTKDVEQLLDALEETYFVATPGKMPQVRVFLYLHLKDGTVIPLQIMTNGFIRYPYLEGYLLKIDDALLDRLCAAWNDA